MSRLRYALVCALTLLPASAAEFRIPALPGPVVIDGKLDEPWWRDAGTYRFESPEFGKPFPVGGEGRIAVCGEWLCVAARLPEAGELVSISQGVNPSWWREDQVLWTFAVHTDKRNRRLTLAIGPLGAYSFESAASLVSNDGWTAEAAVPLARLATTGFLSAERIRAPRPDAPELRWYFPAPNERVDFEWSKSARVFP
jgi:hypothetical protein